MTAAAATRQSFVVDGRHVPTYNGTSNLRGSTATSDAGIPAVPQRVRPSVPFTNPLTQNPSIPPVPPISPRFEEHPRKPGEPQVPAFDSPQRPNSQSSFFPSRTR